MGGFNDIKCLMGVYCGRIRRKMGAKWAQNGCKRVYIRELNDKKKDKTKPNMHNSCHSSHYDLFLVLNHTKTSTVLCFNGVLVWCGFVRILLWRVSLPCGLHMRKFSCGLHMRKFSCGAWCMLSSGAL
jgi:hypothetical protein